MQRNLLILFLYALSLSFPQNKTEKVVYSDKKEIAVCGEVYKVINSPKLKDDPSIFVQRITLKNMSNPLSTAEWPVNRLTGKPLSSPWPATMAIDMEKLDSVVTEVFPRHFKCFCTTQSNLEDKEVAMIEISAKADPQTGDILSVSFHLSCTREGTGVFSIPIENIWKLERSICENCHCYLPLPRDVYRDEFLNASYLCANAFITFSAEDIEAIINTCQSPQNETM